MTLRRTALWCGAGSAALLCAAALAVTLAVHWPQLIRPWAERALAPRGGTASLSGLTVSIAPPSLELSGISITEPPVGEGDLLRIDHLRFEPIPGRLFHGGPWLRHVVARGVAYERRRPGKAEGPPDLAPLTRLFDIEDLSLTDARLRVATTGGNIALDGLRLTLAPGEGGMRAFNGSGDLSFHAKGSPVFAAKLSGRGTVSPEPSLTVDLASTPGRLELPRIAGSLSGRTRLRLTRRDFRIEDLVLIAPRVRMKSGPGRAIALESIRLTASAGASLEGWHQGKVPLGGRVRGTGHFDWPPIEVRRFRFDAPLAGTLSAPTLPGWILSAVQGEVLYEGRPLPLGTVGIRGSAEPVGDSYRLEGVEIRSGALGRMTGEVAFRGRNASGRLSGTKLPLDNLATVAGVIGGYDGKGWSPTGDLAVAVRLDPVEGGHRVAASATLVRIGFRSPDGNSMGQHLAGTVGLEADWIPRPRWKVDLALRGGEALRGTIYLDLAKEPLDLRFGGTRVGPEEYEGLLLEAGSAGFGRLRIEGKARRAAGGWQHRGRLALRVARLGPVFRTFLRDPLAAAQPDLAGLEMEGDAEVDLSFSGSGKAADLDGALRLRLADLHRGSEPPLLSGLDIDLPVSYSFGAPDPGLPAPSDAGKWGRLRLAKIRISGQEAGPFEAPAILVPNRFHLGETIDTSLYGAKLSLRRMRVDDPLSPGFRVRMAAVLEGLDLSRIAGENPMLEGRLGGTLDPVIIGRERMTSVGRLTGDLFGGRLDVHRVTVERPFSAGREFGADVNVDRIDLERFSSVLGVGRITGRLSGSMAGLRVAYGQPVAFHLKMESVPTKGVTQSVSLKAVNSISLVGTGSALSGLGASLMTTFFREFPYAKIGFECGLNNDVFTVRGSIREDGVEYLVKRRFFTGIDVINGNPDNRIGFSDMMERAKRATSERID